MCWGWIRVKPKIPILSNLCIYQDTYLSTYLPTCLRACLRGYTLGLPILTCRACPPPSLLLVICSNACGGGGFEILFDHFIKIDLDLLKTGGDYSCGYQEDPAGQGKRTPIRSVALALARQGKDRTPQTHSLERSTHKKHCDIYITQTRLL